MEMKYVRHSVIGFVMWPKTDRLWHSHVGALLNRAGGKIISAGFVTSTDGVVVCHGKSESLGISSIPGDTEALAAQFGLITPKWEICQHCGHDVKDPCHQNTNPNAAANCHWNRERTRVLGTGLVNNRPDAYIDAAMAAKSDIKGG